MTYPASVLLEGRFLPEQILVQQVDAPQISAEAAAEIESTWNQELARNSRLRAGPMLAFLAVEETSTEVRCHVAPSNYKKFMGTTTRAFAERWPNAIMPGAAALLVTISSDHQLVIGRRSAKIDYPALYHVAPAGRIRPDEGSPYEAIQTEAAQELGLTVDDFMVILCIGVVSDLVWGRLNKEFVFFGLSHRSLDEIRARAKTAKSADEHTEIIGIPWYKVPVKRFLLREQRRFVPTGWAAVALALRDQMGVDSFPLWESGHMDYEEYMSG